MGAQSRAATLYAVGSASDPDHEAAIRFDGEAPRRRAHSRGHSVGCQLNNALMSVFKGRGAELHPRAGGDRGW